MTAFFYSDFGSAALPVMILMVAFQLWMLVDAIRRQEWIWAVFILIFSTFSALLYFFLVYRPANAFSGGFGRAIEIPGISDRRRIRELKEQVRLLDKAHHHGELGDIYLRRGKVREAESWYRAAIERDASDLDFHARLGECLLRQKRPAEALPALERVCEKDTGHNYGQTQTLYAEALAAVGRKEEAFRHFEEVASRHSYARARVQLSELLLERGDTAAAAAHLRDVVADYQGMPPYQQRREAAWARRAKRLLRVVATDSHG